MDYLLDTNICIYIIKHKPAVVRQRFAALKKTQVYISSISVFELAFGIENGQPGKRNRQALNQFLAPLEIIEFGKEDALYAARIRAALKRMGTPIGPYDLQIAAINSLEPEFNPGNE